MGKKVFILEHIASEKAGTILNYLHENGIGYSEIKLFEKGYKLPPVSDISHLIVMGGPMNVYEEKEHPFLKEENVFIQSVLKANIPYLGICLGSQLLAKALGAKVYKAKAEEVGWEDVKLTPAAAKDRLLGHIPGDYLKVLQWHGDTFDLPAGAIHLASSAIVPNQAYSIKDRFYGLQFHLEVDRPMVEDWFQKREDLPQIVSTHESYRENLGSITSGMYRRFFEL